MTHPYMQTRGVAVRAINEAAELQAALLELHRAVAGHDQGRLERAMQQARRLAPVCDAYTAEQIASWVPTGREALKEPSE